jgi:hypothetical protein
VVFPVTDLVHPGPAAIGLTLIPGLTGGLLAIAASRTVGEPARPPKALIHADQKLREVADALP